MNKQNSLFIFCIVLIYIFANSCANQGSPDGGPRDTIPPAVINSVPANQSLNFKGQTLVFEFDERITAEKLKQQLIISPNTELEYSYVTKKYVLTIKLQTPLQDSTTYNFNFLDGVTDITEKNPVKNFRLAFSTGPYIDSIFVSGKAVNLLSGQPAKNVTIGLYDATDTTNVYEDKPLYFFTADEQGNFKIENIKTGYYNIYAWKDENKNLKLETEKEAYAFLADTLDLYSSKDSILLRTIGLNTKEPEVLSGRIAGRYFDVKINKSVPQVEVVPQTPDKPLAYQYLTTENLVRFYNTQELAEEDSLVYYLTLTDSLAQTITDTVTVKFRPTKKKPEKFEVKSKTTNEQIRNSLTLEITFNKPVKTFNTDSVEIAIDSIASLPVLFQSANADTTGSETGIDSTSSITRQSAPSFTWNTTRTKISLDIPIQWKNLNDTIRSLNSFYILQDSINPDTSRVAYTSRAENQFLLSLPKGTFLSAEMDTLNAETIQYKKEDVSTLGVFILSLKTSLQNYWIELVNVDKKQVERKIKIGQEDQLTISRLKPGKYQFVIKVDDNNDGKWSYGNILENQEPETIIHTGVESDLRANFEVNIELEF